MLFIGKAQSLGVKQSAQVSNKWTELPISKSPKIVQFSVGHEGHHVIMVAEDGAVYFAGTARKGEDGDQGKWLCHRFGIHFQDMKVVQSFS